MGTRRGSSEDVSGQGEGALKPERAWRVADAGHFGGLEPVFPNVRASQTSVTLVVAGCGERVRIEMELKMIFNFIFGRRRQKASHSGALSDLRVGDRAIVRELELDHPIAEHLMNLGFVPGLEVSVERSGPGGDPRVYRVEGLSLIHI